MKNKKTEIMKKEHTIISSKGAIHMQSLEIQYEEKDVDLEEVKRIAQESSMRIQNEMENRLNKAIENHETYYISQELKNVSTYELIKMILRKL